MRVEREIRGSVAYPVSLDPAEFATLSQSETVAAVREVLADIDPNVNFFDEDVEAMASALKQEPL